MEAKKNYEPLAIEILEIKMEKGYAVSDMPVSPW